jgi:hypothetical protein
MAHSAGSAMLTVALDAVFHPLGIAAATVVSGPLGPVAVVEVASVTVVVSAAAVVTVELLEPIVELGPTLGVPPQAATKAASITMIPRQTSLLAIFCAFLSRLAPLYPGYRADVLPRVGLMLIR